jgi:hypothetical protein
VTRVKRYSAVSLPVLGKYFRAVKVFAEADQRCCGVVLMPKHRGEGGVHFAVVLDIERKVRSRCSEEGPVKVSRREGVNEEMERTYQD